VALARTTRVAASASAKAVLSPVEAGSIATAATPAGTLPARINSRSACESAPWRL
jgi:hypothetical protein